MVGLTGYTPIAVIALHEAHIKIQTRMAKSQYYGVVELMDMLRADALTRYLHN
jgi:hypothetical protein